MLAFGAALRVQHDCVTGMAGHTQPPGFVRAKCVSGMARTGYWALNGEQGTCTHHFAMASCMPVAGPLCWGMRATP